MKKVLITGATGTIGKEVIHSLSACDLDVIAAVRDTDTGKNVFFAYPDVKFIQFDFEDDESYGRAFHNIDILFLLRPPHLTDIKKVFRPLLESAKNKGIEKVVFLSVQGAEKSKIIPHNKIEQEISRLELDHIFVRPGYFMQNLTTTLKKEIKEHSNITLPLGKGVFNWVDAKNIGEATAVLIDQFDRYKNAAYEITGKEQKDFYFVAETMSKVYGREIVFNNINPISFYFRKRREGIKHDFAIVMTILHFLPRVQKQALLTDHYHKLTGKEPTTLEQFLQREKNQFF